MINLSGNKKINTLLILVMCTISTTNKSSALSIIPESYTARIVTCALAVGIPSLILLYTKSTPKELKFKTKLNDPWSNVLSDWLKILKVWDIVLNPSEYKKLIGKRWIGTQLSVVDEKTKIISENGGKEVAVTDKKIKCLPTGICGYFDAYVLKQCKQLFDATRDIEKVLVLWYLLYGKDIEKLSNLWPSKTFKASV